MFEMENELEERMSSRTNNFADKIVLFKQGLEIMKAVLPWFVFIVDALIGAYVVYQSSTPSIVAAGVFYLFSLAFLWQRRRD